MKRKSERKAGGEKRERHLQSLSMFFTTPKKWRPPVSSEPSITQAFKHKKELQRLNSVEVK